MTRRVAVTHAIEQRFARPVHLSTHWLRLRPAPHARARITAYSMRVATEPHFLNWFRDAFENHVARLDLPEPVSRLAIEVSLVAELAETNPLDFLVDAGATEHPFVYEPQLHKELAPYLRVDAMGAELSAWLGGLARTPRYVVDRVHEVAIEIGQRFAGSPTELAWLLTLGLRALGLAARFTSGYRIADASASVHAWSEVYLPGAGWIGLDPAAGLFTTEAYVPLACAPEPLRAQPVTGFREASEEEVHDAVAVSVLAPTGPTWPHGDAGWAYIRALGAKVDADLRAAGTRLAVGRELAFTSVTDAGSPEWTSGTLGEGKRRAADTLLSALRPPGALVQTGYGEWYAGEPVMRWRIACLHRVDGRPIWRNAALLDRPATAAVTTLATAQAFGESVARALDVPPACVVPAHEDALHRLWRDERDAVAAAAREELRDPERRRRLADRLTNGAAGPPVGYVLALGRDDAGERWRSGVWAFRRSRLHLVDGTLPIGFRLPLESLPANDASVPRTALCLEVRDGRLCVFLPPLSRIEDYLELVGAIEAAADALSLPVALEGYEPPEDPRLRRIVVEPDAGVLRVTLPAAASFDEQVALLETVYTRAAELGLQPERLLANGAHEPVGAGASVVLGGTTPEESPLLSRPEILRALVTHWQRHPSLSYFFATRFVGPGGHAPRPDEGRDDALYELRIALERVPWGEGALPWLPDRLLRHLLADPAGDIRRAELRMDQLFDPVHASRRLGRLALGAFEMPPHAHLAALESLLVAALVARFVRDPGAAELRRWGRALHDRFLLPTLLWEDLQAVLGDLDAAGYPFQPDWFAPFLAFHFPVLGSVQLGDVSLELRLAHEPWPVLAQEATGSGLARFVDAANERIEVRATGLTPSRHALACNGRHVPLRATGVQGAWVAGVRYKAWNLPATLHPTTAAVGTLVFDLIDTWTGRAIGGCRFFPARPAPAGRMAPPPPAPDGEAERGRPLRLAPSPLVWQRPRVGGFAPEGSGRGRMAPPPVELGSGYVLDLTAP